MEPEQKADYLIKKFGDLAEDVALECKNTVDAARTPYWLHTLASLQDLRVKGIIAKDINKKSEWMVTYMYANKELCTMMVKAMHAFGESGRFTFEEAEQVVALIRAEPLPDLTGNDFREAWLDFRCILSKKIFDLFGK